jgi:hypothetical protein
MAIRARYRLRPVEPMPEAEGLVVLLGDTAGTSSRLELHRPDATGRLGTVVTHRGKTWRLRNGEKEQLPAAESATWRQMQHAERVVWLLPLLGDKRFTLSALGDRSWRGRTFTGIRVAYPKQKDVRLYFDKDTGLLAKAEYEWGTNRLTEVFHDRHQLAWFGAEMTTLQEAGVAADGRALLAFLRQRIPDAAAEAKMAQLTGQLGSPSFRSRRQASLALQAAGMSAVASLRQAVRDPDPEVALQAGRLLKRLRAASADRVLGAVLRLVAWKDPPGAAEALLDFLPHATPGAEEREAEAALAAVALRGGKPHPCLLRALEGPEPRRRHATAALHRAQRLAAGPAARRLYPRGLRVSHRREFFVKGEKALELELLELELFDRAVTDWFTKP